MSYVVELSPVPVGDTEEFCDVCGEETYHVSTLSEFHSQPGVLGYLLECEPCLMSLEWH